jgi:ABC-type transport system involved in Fe-S cluster assembly fused permease/ATPase subunit
MGQKRNFAGSAQASSACERISCSSLRDMIGPVVRHSVLFNNYEQYQFQNRLQAEFEDDRDDFVRTV